MMDQYVVIGNPIAQSKSPDIHAQFAQSTQQAMHYDRLLAPVDGFEAAMRAFIASGGKGANITAPFKLDAFAFANQLTERARVAGAVNTLKFDGDIILGDNTDGAGLVADITQGAGVSLQGRRILLLGAGGAARGALLPLLEQQPAELVLVNRTAEKAQELAQQVQQYGKVQWGSFDAAEGVFDVVINATSAGLHAQTVPVSLALFGPQTLAYDMTYAKAPTSFMQFAAGAGATTRDGLGMLVAQAAEAFYLWRGIRPDTSQIVAAIRAKM
jgi:shikimate dehydrogenase